PAARPARDLFFDRPGCSNIGRMRALLHRPVLSRGTRPYFLHRSFLLLAGVLGACSAASSPEPDAAAASRAALIAPAPPGGGADLLVSPEIEIDAPILSPAPGSRPAAAFDGTQYLVAWIDVRAHRPMIYGARVAPDGT